jgi:protease I
MESALHPVVIFIDKGFQDIEVMYAKYRLEEAGYRVYLAGPTTGEKYTGKYGYPVVSEVAIHELQERIYSGAVCCGGWAPLSLRADGKVRAIIGEFFRAGKTVGAICNGSWMTISAGICRGLRVTGPASLRDDLVNAGAIVHDAPVVIDRNLITAKYTNDLPQFMKAVIEALDRQVRTTSTLDKVGV